MRRHRHRSQPGRTLVIVVALLTLLGCLSTISPAVSRRRYALHSFARGEAKLESRNIEAERVRSSLPNQRNLCRHEVTN